MSDKEKTDIGTRFEVSYLEQNEGSADMRAAIERHGGRVLQERPLEKVRLAFPIKKQTYAFLGCIEFVMDPAAVNELQQAEFRLNKELLRTLVHRSASLAPAAEGESPRPLAPRVSPSRPPRPKEETILTNEALEKKIEEILQ